MDRVEIVAELLEAISETLFSEEHVAEEVPAEEKVDEEAAVVATSKSESEKTKSKSKMDRFV